MGLSQVSSSNTKPHLYPWTEAALLALWQQTWSSNDLTRFDVAQLSASMVGAWYRHINVCSREGALQCKSA